MKAIFFPLLIIALGVGWLLTVQGVLPGVNWVWVLGLGAAGVAVLGIIGIDKATMVIGPFLIFAMVLSLLRQTKRLTIDSEVPVLVIGFGILLLLVQLIKLPPAKWLYDPQHGDGPIKPS
jgi:hypothetical protein